MRTITTMLILSGVLAHAAIAQASTTTADSGTKIAQAATQAPAGQAADANASAAPDKPKAAGPRPHVRAARATGADLRHCLDRKSNEAIIRCTEGKK